MDSDTDDDITTGISETAALRAIKRGARMLRSLKDNHSGELWDKFWVPAIRGWRGMRELAFRRANTRDHRSHAYKVQMGQLLTTADGTIYEQVPKETRAAMTRLIDKIEEIDIWHKGLTWQQRNAWENPQTVAKHAPKHLLSGGKNDPKPKKAKKETAEERRLRAIITSMALSYWSKTLNDEAVQRFVDDAKVPPALDDPDDGLDWMNTDVEERFNGPLGLGLEDDETDPDDEIDPVSTALTDTEREAVAACY